LDKLLNLPEPIGFKSGFVSSIEKLTQSRYRQVERGRFLEAFIEGRRFTPQMIDHDGGVSRTLPVALIDLFAAFFDDPGQFVALLRSQRTRSALDDVYSFGGSDCLQPMDVVRRAVQPIRRQRL
jgi:hypothetical protein